MAPEEYHSRVRSSGHDLAPGLPPREHPGVASREITPSLESTHHSVDGAGGRDDVGVEEQEPPATREGCTEILRADDVPGNVDRNTGEPVANLRCSAIQPDLRGRKRRR